MTKAKPMTPKNTGSTPKGNLRGVKDTPIGKNKSPKFKVTPSGKVPLINGSTPKGNANKNTPKGAGNFQKSPKNQNNSPHKQNTPKNAKKSPNGKQSPGAQKTPQGKKNTPKGKSPAQSQELTEEQLKAKVVSIVNLEGGSDDSDDDEDINEGVQINEDISEEDSEDDDAEDDEESDSTGVKDILGNSLADDSDDDDDDFDEEDDDVAGVEEKKGVKMFKGLASVEDDDDEDDSDDDEENESGTGLESLLGQSLADDDDDEDFEEGDDDDEDDDDDISDEDEDEDLGSPVKKQDISIGEDDSDDDSEDDEDDAETAKFATSDKGVKEASSDDDDDEKVEENIPKLTEEELRERDKRTIFVGNLPKETKKGQLKNVFRKFGVVETIRFRGIVPENPNIPLKVAAIKRKFHPKTTTIQAFITFLEQASAVKAIAMNGQKFAEHYLRVDLAKSEARPDQKKAVFLGNLNFKVEENDIWSHFGECGKIVSVRVPKDRRTGAGKGFGYINFDSTDAVTLALKLNGTTLQNREIRVKLCDASPPKDVDGKKRPWKHLGKRSHPTTKQGQGSPKKFKDETGKSVAVAKHNSQNAERRKETKFQKRSQGEQQRGNKSTSPFQGQKADFKNKPKFNKTDKKKKHMAEKLAVKPKKPSGN